jgi:hypothetical protein
MFNVHLRRLRGDWQAHHHHYRTPTTTVPRIIEACILVCPMMQFAHPISHSKKTNRRSIIICLKTMFENPTSNESCSCDLNIRIQPRGWLQKGRSGIFDRSVGISGRSYGRSGVLVRSVGVLVLSVGVLVLSVGVLVRSVGGFSPVGRRLSPVGRCLSPVGRGSSTVRSGSRAGRLAGRGS